MKILQKKLPYKKVGVAIALLVGCATVAQAYPTKPIRMIIPFVPGGGTDVVVRTVQNRLSEELGQSLVVDFRGGANSNIGADIASKAPPDGYTVLMGTVNLAVNRSLYPKLPYDLVKDFETVTVFVESPFIFLVHPTVPVKSVNEFVAYAKKSAGKLAYASNGSGSPPQLAAEMFKSMANVEMTHVAYKGSGAALVDVMAGRVQVMFGSIGAFVNHVKSGKLTGLAVTGSRRAAVLSELPTLIESGFPGYEIKTWYAMFVPRGTPSPIINRLHSASAKVLNEPSAKSAYDARGLDVVANTPEEFRVMLLSEIDKYAKVLKASGAKLE